MQRGLVFNIQKYSIHDGPGIRTTVFLKGCPLRCWWCHNPESMEPGPEIMRIETRCSACGECRAACDGDWPPGGDRAASCVRCGACAAVCPSDARRVVGAMMTVDDVMNAILDDRIFFDESGGGATFSGGEPLLQSNFLMELLDACRRSAVHTAIDTSGFAPQDELLAAARLADLVLYDIKTLDDAAHRRHTGASNVRIVENLKALSCAGVPIWLRVPVIPGVNDAPEQIEAIGRLAASLPGLRQVNLLRYHETGAPKWVRLGKSRPAVECPRSSDDSISEAADRLRSLGLNVFIGG